jgi:hypothetical protein
MKNQILGIFVALFLLLGSAAMVSAGSVDVSYDGYCDVMYFYYDLATGLVDGYQTGCTAGPTLGTVAKEIFSQGTGVTMGYDETADYGHGISTVIRQNGTWTHYRNTGDGIYVVNSGTWSPGPPAKDALALPRSAE